MSIMVKIFSHRNWGLVRYNAIFQDLTALLYLAFIGREWNLDFLALSFLFFLFSLIMTAFGYLVNDLSDIDLDRLHGKPNAFSRLSRGKAALITISVLLVGVSVSIPFLSGSWFWFFLFLWILTATIYSLPPVRLKERGGWGLAATVLAQQTLPLILLFTAFQATINSFLLAFIVYVTIRGLSSDLGHQIRDWKNDEQTKTRTFAVRIGYEKALRFYMVSLESERLLVGMVMALLYIELLAVNFKVLGLSVPIAVPPFLVTIYLLFRTVGTSYRSWKQGKLPEIDPYNEARQALYFDDLRIIHHTLPTVLVPLYLSIVLTFIFPPNVIFLIYIFFIFNLFRPSRWVKILRLSIRNR